MRHAANRPPSLYSRITASILAATALVILAQGTVGLLTVRRIGATITGEREALVAETVAELFAQYAREHPAAGPGETAQSTAAILAHVQAGLPGRDVFFMPLHGKPRGSGDIDPRLGKLLAARLRDYREGKMAGSSYLYYHQEGLIKPIGTAPVYAPDGRTILGLAATIALVPRALIAHTLTLYTVILAALAVTFSALIGLGLFAGLQRTLKAFARASEEIARGRTEARVVLPAGRPWARELDSLAATFNSMAQTIEETQARKRELFGDISHELGTPLTTLRTYLETLQLEDFPLDDETRHQYLEVAMAEVMRMDRLVSDILDLARLDTGEVTLDLQETSLVVVLEATAKRNQLTAKANGVALTLSLPEGCDPKVIADPMRLGQVLQNLTDNAIKAMPRGGELLLGLEVQDGKALISIADTGVGIPALELERVFERYYKISVPAGRRVSGRGLGLALARKLIEMHGGEIWTESETGKGSTFFIRLPMANSSQSPAAIQQ